MPLSINILLLGRSGAGKSSLANYLYRKPVFATGEGAPVTPLHGPVQKAVLEAPGYTLTICDAPGLEPANYPAWQEEIDAFMRENGTVLSRDPSHWIHGAFYCINAGTGRVEPAEIDVIRRFPIRYRTPVSVVLTNCDAVPEEEVDALEATIRREFGGDVTGLSISRVCSVERRKRGGKLVLPFGREALLRDHTEKVAQTFQNRMGLLLFGTIIPDIIRRYTAEFQRVVRTSGLGLVRYVAAFTKGAYTSAGDELGLGRLRDALLGTGDVSAVQDFVGSLERYFESLGGSPKDLDLRSVCLDMLDISEERVFAILEPEWQDVANLAKTDVMAAAAAVLKNLPRLEKLREQACTMASRAEANLLAFCEANARRYAAGLGAVPDAPDGRGAPHGGKGAGA